MGIYPSDIAAPAKWAYYTDALPYVTYVCKICTEYTNMTCTWHQRHLAHYIFNGLQA